MIADDFIEKPGAGVTTYSEYSEEKVLTLLASGDKGAFKWIYFTYFPRIFSYARKFTRSADLAEDIAQDVFLKVWENRADFLEIRYLEGYLFTICKNTTLNVLSRAARETRIYNLIMATIPHAHTSTENEIQTAEYEMLLSQAIERLPSQRKKIFQLCKIEGKSYEHVARELGVSTGTVNDHIVKATRSVRSYLMRYDIALGIMLITSFFQKKF
ncbi:RNA polymerase sigma factor [Dyadobacter alkalitolerans]|uniref:RNA polymerase sigma factor n=1 Tax=Dyadobacter alkalitolerans TaxID=492736 RepID=UPI000402F43E|nr:RNA polymerase sigma-70 factor [Dyadobacter alkalitolerans]